MPKVDPTALEAVIKQAGLGGRSAKKLREANDPVSSEKETPRGHGAANQDLSPVGGDL